MKAFDQNSGYHQMFVPFVLGIFGMHLKLLAISEINKKYIKINLFDDLKINTILQ